MPVINRHVRHHGVGQFSERTAWKRCDEVKYYAHYDKLAMLSDMQPLNEKIRTIS